MGKQYQHRRESNINIGGTNQLPSPWIKNSTLYLIAVAWPGIVEAGLKIIILTELGQAGSLFGILLPIHFFAEMPLAFF